MAKPQDPRPWYRSRFVMFIAGGLGWFASTAVKRYLEAEFGWGAGTQFIVQVVVAGLVAMLILWLVERAVS
ncbi:hypothetical protein [Methylobacterium sp. WSM2598]|uniref:hypothetical protein n=1 Tax=Methylobacterium sp. WSM2598 TaxID=398261 RepID=UPI00039A0F78|nr:hypothetical protein [Methylobacterium sp. WSM2598]